VIRQPRKATFVISFSSTDLNHETAIADQWITCLTDKSRSAGSMLQFPKNGLRQDLRRHWAAATSNQDAYPLWQLRKHAAGVRICAAS
jgi:hypothetical protein